MPTPHIIRHNALFVSGEYNRPWYAVEVKNPNGTQILRVGDVCNFTFFGQGSITFPLVNLTKATYTRTTVGWGGTMTTPTSKKRGLVAGVVWNSDIGPGETGVVAAAGLLPTRVWGNISKGNYLALSSEQVGHGAVFATTRMVFIVDPAGTDKPRGSVSVKEVPPGFFGQAYEDSATTGSNIVKAFWWPWRF